MPEPAGASSNTTSTNNNGDMIKSVLVLVRIVAMLLLLFQHKFPLWNAPKWIVSMTLAVYVGF